MKVQAFVISALALATPALAQPTMPPMVPIAAPADPDAIVLYGGNAPGSASTEVWSRVGADTVVRDVTRATLTPVLPDPAKATGAAVIVMPGGAFMLLSMDHEGWQVAHALAARGIAAFVLKYRLVHTPEDPKAAEPFMRERLIADTPHPMTGVLLPNSGGPGDGAAAVALVRAQATKWRLDPARVGIMGFSAGAMSARRVALDTPAATGPAFIGYIYGTQDAEPVSAAAPPLFDAIALDDPIAQSWLAANHKVEIHGYQTGSHGFGLGVPGTTTTLMLDEFVAWLSMQGFLTKKVAP
jgi:acetyl esterase/lipase